MPPFKKSPPSFFAVESTDPTALIIFPRGPIVSNLPKKPEPDPEPDTDDSEDDSEVLTAADAAEASLSSSTRRAAAALLSASSAATPALKNAFKDAFCSTRFDICILCRTVAASCASLSLRRAPARSFNVVTAMVDLPKNYSSVLGLCVFVLLLLNVRST